MHFEECENIDKEELRCEEGENDFWNKLVHR